MNNYERIDLDDDIDAKLNEIAKTHGLTTKQEAMRHLMRFYFMEYKQPTIRIKKDGKLNITFEDRTRDAQ